MHAVGDDDHIVPYVIYFLTYLLIMIYCRGGSLSPPTIVPKIKRLTKYTKHDIVLKVRSLVRFIEIGKIMCLRVNKNAPRGNTLVRKGVTKVTRTRRWCFVCAKHFYVGLYILPISARFFLNLPSPKRGRCRAKLDG